MHTQMHKNKDYGPPGAGGDVGVTTKKFRVSLRREGVMKCSKLIVVMYRNVVKCTECGDVQPR